LKKILSNFKLIALFALVVSAIPIINLPFTWVTVFFHEISHGLAAIVTGGKINKIHLNLLGSGLCYTTGGVRFIILQSGYLGAIIWGILIYSMADFVKTKNIHLIIYVILSLLAIVLLLWGRDLMTWIILVILFLFFLSLIKLQGNYLIKFLLKFIGIYVLLDAVRSPLYLIDGRHYGDGAKLSDLTSIPEIFWVIIWFSIGVLSIFKLWKYDKKSKRHIMS
jgi:hypothetical protein